MKRKKWKKGVLTPNAKKEEKTDMSMDDAIKILQTVPIAGILASIETQIKILNGRGVTIQDWDNKQRKLEQITMIGGKVYFLASEGTKG